MGTPQLHTSTIICATNAKKIVDFPIWYLTVQNGKFEPITGSEKFGVKHVHHYFLYNTDHYSAKHDGLDKKITYISDNLYRTYINE